MSESDFKAGGFDIEAWLNKPSVQALLQTAKSGTNETERERAKNELWDDLRHIVLDTYSGVSEKFSAVMVRVFHTLLEDMVDVSPNVLRNRIKRRAMRVQYMVEGDAPLAVIGHEIRGLLVEFVAAQQHEDNNPNTPQTLN